MAPLKRKEMVFNVFKSGILSMASENSERELEKSDDNDKAKIQSNSSSLSSSDSPLHDSSYDIPFILCHWL